MDLGSVSFNEEKGKAQNFDHELGHDHVQSGSYRTFKFAELVFQNQVNNLLALLVA